MCPSDSRFNYMNLQDKRDLWSIVLKFTYNLPSVLRRIHRGCFPKDW